MTLPQSIPRNEKHQEDNGVELPSLETVDDMEKQQARALESLEISEDKNAVKCQNCGDFRPIVKIDNDNSRLRLSHNFAAKISRLQKIIEWSEKNHAGSNRDNCKKEREEIAGLLEEGKKRDFLRSLPLYASPITSYKFYCSSCFDKAYDSLHYPNRPQPSSPS